MNRLDAAVAETARALDRLLIPYMVIGGIAVTVVTSSGVSVDLVCAGRPFERAAIARAAIIEVGGYGVRVCTPEDLIVMKIISARARDREDVRGVIRRQQATLDCTYLDPIVAQLADALAQPDILEFYESLWQ
jgi:hypothetical protein